MPKCTIACRCRDLKAAILHPNCMPRRFPEVLKPVVMGKRSMLDAKDSDIIIPVIGLNGAGKSTFINTAVNEDVAPVGEGLLSCTENIQTIPVVDPRDNTRRVVFVDTPGFNHTWVSDSEIIKCIAEWLKKTYDDKKTVTGIIYLWDISQTRDTARHILDIFCTPKPPRNVVVTTTKWSVPSISHEGERDVALRSYLKEPEVPQFTNTQESAWCIVDRVIRQESFDAKRLRALVESLETYAQPKNGWKAEFAALFKNLLSVKRR